MDLNHILVTYNIILPEFFLKISVALQSKGIMQVKCRVKVTAKYNFEFYKTFVLSSYIIDIKIKLFTKKLNVKFYAGKDSIYIPPRKTVSYFFTNIFETDL